jgi:N-acetylmuramoyl-L-alanine amidase
LLATQKFRIVLTRLGDADPSFEQREITSNLAQAAFFLSFHAGDLGPGSPRIALYTYQPGAPLPATGDPTPSVFVPWDQVQQAHLDGSRDLAMALQQQLSQLSGARVDPPDSAPVRILRSVNAPAVAIEIGSFGPDEDAAPLTNLNFQQQFAAAVAKALASIQTGGA